MRLAVEIYRRLVVSDAVTWPVFWATLASSIIGNLVTTTTASLSVRLLVLMAGQLALWIPLVTLRAISRCNMSLTGPATVLSTALIGLALRALAVGGLSAILLGPEQVRWLDRLVGALFNIGLTFVIATVVVSALRERRDQIAQLKSLQLQALEDSERLRAQQTIQNREILSLIEDLLVKELDSLDRENPEPALEALERTVSDIVRPLSHKLASNERVARTVRNDIRINVSWLDVIDQATRGRPFRPRLTIALLTVEVLAATASYPSGIPAYAAMLVVAYVGLTLFNHALPHVLVERSRLVRIAVVCGAATIVGVVASLITFALLDAAPGRVALSLGSLVFVIAFSIGASIANAFRSDRERVVEGLTHSAESVKREIVVLRQMQWFYEKSLSRALHGPVQTAVTAAAMHIDGAFRAGGLEPEVVDDARKRIIDALGSLANPEFRVIDLSEAADRLRSAWAGLCEVHLISTGLAEEMLDHHSITRSCVIDIATEAVTNAVRHGRASRALIEIGLWVHEPIDLSIKISSNSSWKDPWHSKGLGQRLLEECTLEWNISAGEGSVSVSARVPLV